MVKCPRCGAEGSVYRQRVGKREYIYIRHRRGDIDKKCYMGPADEYVAVQRIYSEAFVPLELKNVADVDLTRVLARIIDAIRLQYQRYVILKQYGNLRELYENLKKLLPELQLVVSDIERDIPRDEETVIAEKLGLESSP
ncbi:MAG: hypothetical protein QXT64_02280 [Desulfurococcaceae archaeon]